MNDTLKERVRLFRIVRDIPYYISLEDSMQDYSCVIKPFLLDRLLSTLGVKSKHILCTFRWGDLSLPRSVLEHAHDPEDTHEFLAVFVPERAEWVTVDPNWDSSVGHIFRVAEWDGLSDTCLAVTPIKTFSAEESAKIIQEEDTQDPSIRYAYLERNKDFFQAFNRWLVDQRVKRA